MSLGKGEEKPKKENPKKLVGDTFEDDVYNINDDEKTPVAWLNILFYTFYF